MSASRVLVLYGTSYGQTEKVARRIAAALGAVGVEPTVVNADHADAGLSPAGFDGAVIGSSVTYSNHRRSVRRFVLAHAVQLNAMPSAFFSVSGAAASSDAKGQAAARRLLDDFLGQTGWNPTLRQTVAGAMAFTKYPFLLRWVLKRISARAGGPTDTSRDHEMTDWGAVDHFAAAFAATLPAADRVHV